MLFNFVHNSVAQEDLNLFLGPFDESDVIVRFDNLTLEEIVSDHLHKFPSKSQARKNGWSGAIPTGFKEWKIGKTIFWTLGILIN
jgi:hypothetical protein